MTQYVRTVTTDTSIADTLASADAIKATLEADGLYVTIGEPYSENTAHSDPTEYRHRVDLTVSDKAPVAETAPEEIPEVEPEVSSSAAPEVETDPESSEVTS